MDERRPPFLQLTENDIARLLAPAFPNARLRSWEPISQGRNNTNYKIRVAGNDETPLVLRLFPGNEGKCVKEVELTALVDSRVATRSILYADPDGSVDGFLFEGKAGERLGGRFSEQGLGVL